MRVLLVEDDPEMAAMLRQTLAAGGFTVDSTGDGRSGLKKALTESYRAIVLDLMLPEVDGLQMCAEFRSRRGATPILMITARDSVQDRIHGLETGADDYLAKPFDVREFLARVKALIRRDRVVRGRLIRVRDLDIDTRQRSAGRGGKPIHLTRLEYGVLEMLAAQIGRVVLKETLLQLVWQDREPGSNKLEVVIKSLRRKLDAAGLNDLIKTVYGYGYTIREEGS